MNVIVGLKLAVTLASHPKGRKVLSCLDVNHTVKVGIDGRFSLFSDHWNNVSKER